jgi:hypothetical protein
MPLVGKMSSKLILVNYLMKRELTLSPTRFIMLLRLFEARFISATGLITLHRLFEVQLISSLASSFSSVVMLSILIFMARGIF